MFNEVKMDNTYGKKNKKLNKAKIKEKKKKIITTIFSSLNLIQIFFLLFQV